MIRQTTHGSRRGLANLRALTLAVLAAGTAGGCSFSSGGGDPPPAKIIVMPSGQAFTCQDGTSQPCPSTRN